MEGQNSSSSRLCGREGGGRGCMWPDDNWIVVPQSLSDFIADAAAIVGDLPGSIHFFGYRP